MTQLIDLDDIKAYVDFATNFDKKRINPHILRAQTENLEGVLGEDLLNTLVSSYEKNYPIQSIAVGSSTVITLIDTSDFTVNGYIAFSGLLSSDTFSQNTGRYKITGITSNTITIDLDSTGLVYTSGGNVGKYLNANNELLRNALIPFLCYCSLIKYLPNANATLTQFGLVTKNTVQSDPVSPEVLGNIISDYKTSMSFHRSKLIQFLKDNSSNYSNYEAVSEDHFAGETIGIKKKRNKYLWSRRT